MLTCSICNVGYLLISSYETSNMLLFPGLVFVAFSQGTIYLTDAIATSLSAATKGSASFSLLVRSMLRAAFRSFSRRFTRHIRFHRCSFSMTALFDIIHLRTFFQMPDWMPNESFDGGAILKNTVFGKCLKKLEIRKAVSAIQKEEPRFKFLYCNRNCNYKTHE